jgi:hypothetical protein
MKINLMEIISEKCQYIVVYYGPSAGFWYDSDEHLNFV